MGEDDKKKDCKSEDVIPPHRCLLAVSDRYLIDLECLKEMLFTVLPVLNEKDIERKKVVNDILARAPGKSNTPDSTKATTPKRNLTITDIEVFISNIEKINKAEKLFRQQTIVSIVSRFDDFLGEFLKIVLNIHPEWLKSTEKTITYKELIDLKSIDKAIQGVIQKEVETLLRGSHEEQINFIDQKLKLGICESFKKISSFYEVTERRNLFVHTGGRISKQYLDKCNTYGLSVDPKITEGNKITASNEYLTDAFACFFEAGLRISQASYRRLFPKALEDADKSLNRLTIKFIESGDYALAERICDFDLAIPEKLRSTDGEYIYYARINRAMAQKFAGKSFEEGLKEIPWQVFHPKYLLCLHVLREEYDKANILMKSADVIKEGSLEKFVGTFR